jgi:hypothetical protein
MNALCRLWKDEGGFVVSTELVLVATILVLSMIVGMKKISSQVLAEMSDVANAIGFLNQSYYYDGAWYWTWGTVPASWGGTGPFIDGVDVIAGDYNPINTNAIPSTEFGVAPYVQSY